LMFAGRGLESPAANAQGRRCVRDRAYATGSGLRAQKRLLVFNPQGILAMNKTELVDAVADDADLSKADASRAVDAMIDAVTDALKKGDKVSLVGFGVFSVRERAARQGRNPKTGQSIT